MKNVLATIVVLLSLVGATPGASQADDAETIAGTGRLEKIENLRELIERQWDALLLREIEAARAGRAALWSRDDSSAEAYAGSVQKNRDRLSGYLGLVDERVPVGNLRSEASVGGPSLRGETSRYEVQTVSWPVLDGVRAEGLLLLPKETPRAYVVVLPDADQTPEMLAGINPGVAPSSQFPRFLAERGICVLIPALIDRRSNWSGDRRLHVYTDESHREWIYRQAYEAGRHLIGYEIQKVQAAVDWFCAEREKDGANRKIGVAGYGEGGLVAFYAAALDERADAAWVSGYFGPREELWREPLYRNVWGLLTEFGDAETASLIAPRGLVVEYSEAPHVVHPSPPDRSERNVLQVAAPGEIATPSPSAVASEWQRAVAFAGRQGAKFLIVADAGKPVTFGSTQARDEFARLLKVDDGTDFDEPYLSVNPISSEENDARQYRQVRELEEFTQEKLRLSEYERETFFWSKLTRESPDQWNQAIAPFRDYFWREVLGKFPDPGAPMDVRTRLLPEHSDEHVRTYETVMQVRPGVLHWGYLLLPAAMKFDEQRPVVVCQHGTAGQPADTLAEGGFYQAYAMKLAQRGFVVYAPYNPTRIEKGNKIRDGFMQLQRKGYLIKKTVYGIYAANHEYALRWLQQLPFVDAKRIGFYGLSYGGKTAMRAPGVLEGYAAVICSGHFSDYVKKMTLPRSDKATIMFSGSYENFQFNYANRFNCAEMAALIAPRPFMLEQGYHDRVPQVDWAAAEYAKVRELYFYLGIPERTEIEYFDGPHQIRGQGTFDFLHRHLQWPKPEG